MNPVAPYEGRTELQMSYLGHGGLRSTLNDQRGADRQPSGYFGDSRQVSDSRGMAFEVDKVESFLSCFFSKNDSILQISI